AASNSARWEIRSQRRFRANMPSDSDRALGKATSPCAGSWPNLPGAVWRSITVRYGSSSMPRSSASKKSVVAGERDRPDVARRRSQWTKYQDRIDAGRLVFIDETWTRTDMAPLRGWAP